MKKRFNRDRMLNFARFIWQRFLDDKCFETAGALSYTTLVSLVPLMVAMFAMFSAFPAFAGARDTLINFAFSNFVPAAGEKLQGVLRTFADHASSLTGISILVMFFSALSMMVSIEDRLNLIWRVHHARTWGSRLLLYWAALTLGPILVVGGIALTSYVTAVPLLQQAKGQPSGGVSQYLLAVLPFLVTFFSLWLMYATVPNREVVKRDAAIGAGIGAVLFEVARWAFALFVSHAQTYQQIYGALAVLPIFLLWIYLSWVIVILCASVAASIDAYEYHAPASGLPENAEFLGLLVVIRHFADAQRAGETLDAALVQAREPYLRTTQVACYFEDLQHADMIQRSESGGWILSRALDSTDLLRVYNHANYRLPMNPAKEAEALGIALPPNLLELLCTLAESVNLTLGTRLDRIYPVPPQPAPGAEESLPVEHATP